MNHPTETANDLGRGTVAIRLAKEAQSSVLENSFYGNELEYPLEASTMFMRAL